MIDKLVKSVSAEYSPAATNQLRQAKTFIVMNPVAGTTDAESTRTVIEETLSSQASEYEIYETRKEDKVSEIVTRAIDAGVGRVAAIGGDGTVSLVASALVNRQIPLGILPAGSGNVLARGLGIPLDLKEALDLFLKAPRIRTLDAMQVEDKYYFLNVSAGISSLVMQRTRRQDKRRFGMLAYLIRGFETISHFRPHLFKVIIDGKEHRMPAAEVLLANASFMGIDPYYSSEREICPDDGTLDLCVVLSRRLTQLPALALELLTHKTTPVPTLECLPVKRELVLDAVRRLPVQADGELAGYTPVRVKLVPEALQVIVPPENKP